MITEQLLRIIPGWSPLTDLQPAQLAARGAKEGKSEKPGAITALMAELNRKEKFTNHLQSGQSSPLSVEIRIRTYSALLSVGIHR